MRAAAVLGAALALLAALPAPARGQVTRQIRVDSVLRARQRDSIRASQRELRAPGDTTRQDTSRAGRGAGVPKSPTRQFPAADSVMEALRTRAGFRVTRFAADSVQLLAEEKEVRLAGQGLIERDGSTLEADTVRYTESNCGVVATGQPRLFDPSGNMVGEGMRYDACNHAGIVDRARTDLVHGGGTWYMIGDMAVDNEEDRVYASHATITSCDLIDPHYHFATREVKWVNKRLMVSRPAVLYVADVPIAWLPFVFQDTRKGRRSGILSPGFGINDIVRFNSGYSRHVTNVGYYWALSDFTDAQVSLDWYAGVSLSLQGRLRYRWLNRFLAGGIAVGQMRDNGGSSTHISWSHEQQFSLASRLTANLDYATSSRIISRNAYDPNLVTGTIDSRLNYQRKFSAGTLNIGGSRSQSLARPQVSVSFPTVTFTPTPIAISRAITWSPSASFTNALLSQSGAAVAIFPGPGLIDSLRTSSRQSNFSLGTPVRVGQWNIANTVTITDAWSNRRLVIKDTMTGVTTTSLEQFQTDVDFTTGIGLPSLFQGTWNLQPAVSMVNTAGGAFMVRNTYTRGRFVSQGKRFQFALNVSPTLFGLFPGFGPVARVRHALSPSVSWAYSPAAEIPAEYARAIGQGQLPRTLTQPARQAVTFGLSQNFEAKLRVPRTARNPGDSAAADTSAAPGVEAPEGRKLKLLSIQSGSISYDFEQAKIPGRTGWATPTWSNTVSSDLVRGLSVQFTHDLWDGQVGYRGTRFAPSLTSMTFGFSIGASSLNLARRLLGLAPRNYADRPDSAAAPPSPLDPGRNPTNAFRSRLLANQPTTVDRLTPSRGGGAFQAQFNYSLQKPRAVAGATAAPPNSQLSGTFQFSPTAHWTVSWKTDYNFTQGQFLDHVVRLDRDLHDWRASFAFVKNPNGNFFFTFNIALIAEPDLKFNYDQHNVQ